MSCDRDICATNEYNGINCEECGLSDGKENNREIIVFEELIVEYLPPETCFYPEYKGKPYFSIKYRENGEGYIGYGTYSPKVLSRYLKEYFIANNECNVPYDTAVQREQDAYDSGFEEAIEGALEIIKDYDLYKSDEDGDLVACKWEVWAEIKALEEDRNGKVYRD